MKPIHLDKIKETKNNGPMMVKLKNYIDFWIILWIKDRLDFYLFIYEDPGNYDGSLVDLWLYMNCKCDD